MARSGTRIQRGCGGRRKVLHVWRKKFRSRQRKLKSALPGLYRHPASGEWEHLRGDFPVMAATALNFDGDIWLSAASKNTFRRPSAPRILTYATPIQSVDRRAYRCVRVSVSSGCNHYSCSRFRQLWQLSPAEKCGPEYGLRWCCSAPSEIIDYRLINRYIKR